MQWVCHNGVFLPADQVLFTADNRSFKWGDGLFETAKFYKGRLLLSAYHFDRLFAGLQLLNIESEVTPQQLISLIAALCVKNSHTDLARVRLAMYRADDSKASFVIASTALEQEKMQWNKEGWRLVIYPFARKSCDVFANLKSANYLPYVMAAQYAKAHAGHEALVLNMHNHICDGSKTNLFFLKKEEVYTPALSEGCVAGVMRRAVIDFLKNARYAVHQKSITEEDLLQADQVFVTNAVEGIRWVRQVGSRNYEYGDLKKLYNDLFTRLYTA